MPVRTEQIDEKHRLLVHEMMQKTIAFLDFECPRSEKYSHLNLVLNVLTNCIGFIAAQAEPEYHEAFCVEHDRILREMLKKRREIK